jgi:hypothetical protein
MIPKFKIGQVVYYLRTTEMRINGKLEPVCCVCSEKIDKIVIRRDYIEYFFEYFRDDDDGQEEKHLYATQKEAKNVLKLGNPKFNGDEDVWIIIDGIVKQIKISASWFNRDRIIYQFVENHNLCNFIRGESEIFGTQKEAELELKRRTWK